MLSLAIDQHRDQLTINLRNEQGDIIRRIIPASQKDAEVRLLSNFRQFLVVQRTRLIHKVKGILNKHNMLQDAPTKLSWKSKFRKWLETVTLPCVDRLEVDAHLELWKTYNKQILTIEMELAKRTENNKEVAKIAAIEQLQGKCKTHSAQQKHITR